MVNKFQTINAITENLRSLLEKEGLHMVRENFGDDRNAPSSSYPYGVLLYEGEDFEYTHGQRPGYAEAAFRVRLGLRNSDLPAMTVDEQRWAHRIREAVTVNALNTGSLATVAPVSRVDVRSVKVERKGHVSRLDCSIVIRYR